MTPHTREYLENQIRVLDARSAASHERAFVAMKHDLEWTIEHQKRQAVLKDMAMTLRFMLIDYDSKPIVFTELEISRLRNFAWGRQMEPEMLVLSKKLDLMVPDARRDEWRQFNEGWEDYNDETQADTPAG